MVAVIVVNDILQALLAYLNGEAGSLICYKVRWSHNMENLVVI